MDVECGNYAEMKRLAQNRLASDQSKNTKTTNNNDVYILKPLQKNPALIK